MPLTDEENQRYTRARITGARLAVERAADELALARKLLSVLKRDKVLHGRTDQAYASVQKLLTTLDAAQVQPMKPPVFFNGVELTTPEQIEQALRQHSHRRDVPTRPDCLPGCRCNWCAGAYDHLFRGEPAGRCG